MLFSHSSHFCGTVEDRNERGVEAGTAAYGAALQEEEGGLEALRWVGSALCEALAQALWAFEVWRLLCRIPPKYVQERI